MSRKALVVGINRYPLLKDPETQKAYHLKNCADDAEAIAQRLENYGLFEVERLPETIDAEGKPKVCPKPLPNRPIGAEDLKQEICALFHPTPSNSSKPLQTALLFFSGHGLIDDSTGIKKVYLATSRTNPSAKLWGVSLDWLVEQIKNSPVRQIIIWLDCCYSGEFLDLVKQEIDNFLIGDRDFGLIAACQANKQAYELDESEHGILTEALLSALPPNNHLEAWLTNQELTEIVKTELSSKKQTPVCRNIGGEILLTDRPERLKRATLMKEVCPYMGLESFGQEDAQFFYGRTTLTDRLLEKIQAGNFLAVVGPSGSGKSSVVKAGLLHELTLGERIRGSDLWPMIIFRPGELGENPLEFLSEKLTTACGENIQLEKAEDLPGLIAPILSRKNAQRVVWVIDQFEEFFTTCDVAERKQFIENVLSWLNSGQNWLTVVLTLRADFMIKVNQQDYPVLSEKIEQCKVDVTRMNSEELGEAIVKPADRVGIEVQRELVDRMKMWFDVSGSGSLPLIQYTLRELWENRQVNRLSLAAYHQLGGVEKALTKRADRVYEELSAEQQQVAKRIFLKLTQLGEGTEDTRRQIVQDDLVNEHQSIPLIESTLKKLTDARLLVTSDISKSQSTASTGQQPGRAIDVAHEALIRHWPRLQSWLDEETRKAIRIERKIEAEAKDWFRAKTDLLKGTRLSEAEEYLKKDRELGLLSALGKEYIQKSIRQGNFDRRMGYGFIAGFVVIVTLFCLQVAKSAKEATRRAIQAEALVAAKVESNPVIALTKAIELTGRSQKEFGETLPRVQSSLFETIQVAHERNRLDLEDTVTSVAIAPNGSKIVSGSWDNTIRVWDIHSGEEAVLFGHESYVTSVAISLDGSKIVSGSEDRTIRVWDIQSGEDLAVLEGHESEVRSVAVTPDGSKIVSGSEDRTIRVWDIQSEKELAVLKGHEGDVISVAIAPDGSKIVSGSADRTIRVWDIEDGSELAVLKGHEDDVYSVTITPDGLKVVSGSLDKTIRVWDIEDGSELAVLEGHESEVRSVAIAPDGSKIVSGSNDNTIRVWDIQSGKELAVLKGHEDDVTTVAITGNADESKIVSGSEDRTIRVWDIEDGSELAVLKGHEDIVYSVAISLDGSKIVSGSADNTIRVWDLQSEKEPVVLEGHKDHVYSVAITLDGSKVVSGSLDNTIRVWDIQSKKQLAVLKGHEDYVWSVAIAPNGSKIVSGSKDKTIRVWDIQSGEQLAVLEGHEDYVISVAITPDGSKVVSGSADKTIRVWDIQSKKQLALFKDHENYVYSVAITPDGSKVVSGSLDKTIRVWDIQSGKELADFNLESDVHSVAIAPDGSKVFSGSLDKMLRVWDLESESELAVLKGHKNSIISVAIAPDGSKIVSGLSDNTIRVSRGNWKSLLKKGCNQLRLHPVFVEAKARAIVEEKQDLQAIFHSWWKANTADAEITDAEIAAVEAVKTCEEMDDEKGESIWTNREKAELRVQQGLAVAAVARLTDNFAQAKEKFDQAKELDASFYQSLGYDPEAKAKKLRAAVLVSEGEKLGEEGKLQEAIDKFTQAKNLDFSLDFDPEAKAKKLLALFLISQGKKLGEEGKLQEGIDKFTEAKTLDSSLDFDPYVKAKALVVASFVNRAAELMKKNQAEAALAKYKEAQGLDSKLEKASKWDLKSLCWYGSLRGYAAEVMTACEIAVKRDPNDGGILDSRGVARALTGDYPGAISDFETFIKELQKEIKEIENINRKKSLETYKVQRQGWVDALKKKENPFTEEVLQELLEQ